MTVFTYDDQNRVTSMLRATELNGSGHTGPTWTYTYSAATPDAAGTTKVTDPENHSTTYEHDADGQVEKVTDALERSRSKKYDANHNVEEAADAMGVGGGAGNVTTYGWDSRNNPTSSTLPTGVTASVTGYQTIAGADLPGTMTTADAEKTDYTYDTAGNTKSVAVQGTGGGNETAGASTLDGTRTGVKWSDYSQMTSITTGGKTYAGQYGSTDQSERIKLGDTFFHNGPLGLSATSTAGVDTGFNREPGGTLNSMTRGGKNHYYLTDALGSGVALADESGTKVNTYAYSPRGVQRVGTSEQVPQPYRFAGGYQDPTGLYHFAARYYDPNIGRFTSPDPSGQEGHMACVKSEFHCNGSRC